MGCFIYNKDFLCKHLTFFCTFLFSPAGWNISFIYLTISSLFKESYAPRANQYGHLELAAVAAELWVCCYFMQDKWFVKLMRKCCRLLKWQEVIMIMAILFFFSCKICWVGKKYVRFVFGSKNWCNCSYVQSGLGHLMHCSLLLTVIYLYSLKTAMKQYSVQLGLSEYVIFHLWLI